MKKFKGILLTVCLTFLIIDCAILLVTFVPVLYPSSLIASNIGVSEKIVRESYMTIIHYLSLFSHKALCRRSIYYESCEKYGLKARSTCLYTDVSH